VFFLNEEVTEASGEEITGTHVIKGLREIQAGLTLLPTVMKGESTFPARRDHPFFEALQSRADAASVEGYG
jgi:hypothetical protein